jgi:hypothetical protein
MISLLRLRLYGPHLKVSTSESLKAVFALIALTIASTPANVRTLLAILPVPTHALEVDCYKHGFSEVDDRVWIDQYFRQVQARHPSHPVACHAHFGPFWLQFEDSPPLFLTLVIGDQASSTFNATYTAYHNCSLACRRLERVTTFTISVHDLTFLLAPVRWYNWHRLEQFPNLQRILVRGAAYDGDEKLDGFVGLLQCLVTEARGGVPLSDIVLCPDVPLWMLAMAHQHQPCIDLERHRRALSEAGVADKIVVRSAADNAWGPISSLLNRLLFQQWYPGRVR